MAFCPKKLPRKHRSCRPRVISLYVFCYPGSKAYCLCRMCLQKQHTTELQPEKYQHLHHNIRRKESRRNSNIDFLNWFNQHISTPRWLSFYNPPITTDVLFSANLHYLHFISCSTVLLRLHHKQQSWHGTNDHKKMVSVCRPKIFRHLSFEILSQFGQGLTS